MSTNDELKNEPANGTKPVLGEGACNHTQVSDIGYCLGFDGRLYDGFCEQCEEKVYARIGKKTIRWNRDRNGTFA